MSNKLMGAMAVELFNRSEARLTAYTEFAGVPHLSIKRLAAIIRKEWEPSFPKPATDKEWLALAQDVADYLLPRRHQTV